MNSEFVVFDSNGVEVERIDPVLDFDESEKYWIVDNGYHVYAIKKQAGQRHEIRIMRDGDFFALPQDLSEEIREVLGL